MFMERNYEILKIIAECASLLNYVDQLEEKKCNELECTTWVFNFKIMSSVKFYN